MNVSHVKSPPKDAPNAPLSWLDDNDAVAPAANAPTSCPNSLNTKSSVNSKHCPAPDVATRARTGLGESGDAVSDGVAVPLGVRVIVLLGDGVCDPVIDGVVPNEIEAEEVAVMDAVFELDGVTVDDGDTVDDDVTLGVGG